MIENVPNTAKFSDIIQSLGPPIIVEAHHLGSLALRKTPIWTNAASIQALKSQYANAQCHGQTVANFLRSHGIGY